MLFASKLPLTGDSNFCSFGRVECHEFSTHYNECWETRSSTNLPARHPVRLPARRSFTRRLGSFNEGASLGDGGDKRRRKKNKKGVLMVSVIDISEMRLIKKQIFLSLGLFFSFSYLDAMCPQTVGSISINEGIWNVLTRVGAANNVIQSQICDLNTSISSSNCILFGQSDIGAGGVYTINSPGVYCMSNDATFTTGAAITVNSSDVTIDMQNHMLNAGSHSGTTGIVINGGVSNVTIKNGNIVNPTVACISNNSSTSLLQNIIIQNMNFSVIGGTTSHPGVLIQQNSLTAQFNSVLIENCTGYNCYISLSGGSACVVRGCVLVSALTNGNANIAIFGPAGFNTQLAIIEDCTLVNDFASYPAGVASFFLEFVSMAIIRNCVSSGSATQAFTFSAVARPVVSNCVAQQCVSDGFYFVPGAAGATPPVTVSVDNCFAQKCHNGFFIASVMGNVGYDGVVLTNCVAHGNTSCGFKINNAGTGNIPLICMNCTANGNAADGFEIGGGVGSAGPIGYGVITACSSSENSSNGYLFSAQATDLAVEHCTAVSNAGFGFFDANSPTTIYYIANRSLVNGTNYSAVIQAQFSYEPGPVEYGMNIYSL